MVVFISVEHLKLVGYAVSGFAAARVWFAKEIALGKKDTAKVVAAVKAEIVKVESESKNFSLEYRAAFSAIVNRLKKLL